MDTSWPKKEKENRNGRTKNHLQHITVYESYALKNYGGRNDLTQVLRGASGTSADSSTVH